MAGVGELVRSTPGAWMVRPPQRWPRGHLLRPGRMPVGSIACSCGPANAATGVENPRKRLYQRGQVGKPDVWKGGGGGI